MKKKKKTIMASFKQKQVGKGREWVKIEIFVPSISYQIRNSELKKNSKKIQKIRKHQYGFFSGQNMLEKAEKEWKWKLLFRSFPTRLLIENSEKKKAKKFKKLQNTIMAYFLANPGWEKPRKSENKNYRSDHSLPDP